MARELWVIWILVVCPVLIWLVVSLAVDLVSIYRSRR